MNSLFHYQKSNKPEAQAKAPGKLYVAGEYAILQAHQPAIIMSVNQYITVSISSSDTSQSGVLTSQLAELEVFTYQRNADGFIRKEGHSSNQLKQWRYVLTTISIVETLLHELDIPIQDYHLSVTTELISESGHKLGFGSSGAVTVATVKALLKFYGLTALEPLVIYKLAALVLTEMKSNGSMGDVAASAYGHWIYYQAVDREWLQKQWQSTSSVIPLIEMQWKDLEIKYLPELTNIALLVGWTQSPASTDNLVGKLEAQLPSNPQPYHSFLTEAKNLVENLHVALLEDQLTEVKTCINQYNILLQALAEAYHLPIITEDLDKLIQIANDNDFAGKSSGAGGGDCGIAIGEDHKATIERIQKQWRSHHILPLHLSFAPAIKDL